MARVDIESRDGASDEPPNTRVHMLPYTPNIVTKWEVEKKKK